jgi:hypothetical protein
MRDVDAAVYAQQHTDGPGRSADGGLQEPTTVRVTNLLKLYPTHLEEHYWEHTCSTTATGLDQLYCAMSMVTIVYAVSTTNMPASSQQLHLCCVAALALQAYLIEFQLHMYIKHRARLLLVIRFLKQLSLSTVLVSYHRSHELRLNSTLDVIRAAFVLTGVMVNTLNALAYRMLFRHQLLIDTSMTAMLAACTVPQLSTLLSSPTNLPIVSRLYHAINTQSATFFQHMLLTSVDGPTSTGSTSPPVTCAALTLVSVLQLFCCLVVPLYTVYMLERAAKLRSLYRYQQLVPHKPIVLDPLYEYPYMELRASDKVTAAALHLVKLTGLALVTWLVVDTAVHHVLVGALGSAHMGAMCGAVP